MTSKIVPPSTTQSPFADADLESHCPVCLEAFVPPVFQCNNGHVICQNCELQIQHCPVCRESMPCRKIRSLAFEKILISIANTPTQCPKQLDGCDVIVKKKDVDDHLLECAFVRKQFCVHLGFDCTQEYCTSKMSDMISHLIFFHNLDGSISEGDDSSTSKLELAETFDKSNISQLLELKFLQPNFIRFDDRIFFVKKNVNETEKLVSIMVCIDATSTTASKYSALIQLYPGNAGVSVAFEFKQREVALLTRQFDVDVGADAAKSKTNQITLCKIPFSTIEYYGRSDDDQCKDLSLKFHVSILKNLDAPVNVGSNKTKASDVSSSLPSMETRPRKADIVISDPVQKAPPQVPPRLHQNQNSQPNNIPEVAPGRNRNDQLQEQHQGQEQPLNSNSNSTSNSQQGRQDHQIGSVHKMFNRLFKPKSGNAKTTK